MRILVTGGSGFIGGFTVMELESRGAISDADDLDIFDKSYPAFETSSQVILGDIEDVGALQPYDVVIHCAGLLGSETLVERAAEAERVNVLGTLAVLELQKETGIVIQPGLLGRWLNPYMISKNTSERYGWMYRKLYDTQYVSVRATDVYGPRQSLTQKKVTPSLILAALADRPLPVYGDGSYEINLLYVKDLAKVLASLALARYTSEGTLDITSGFAANAISVRKFGEMIIKEIGSNSELGFLEMRIGQNLNDPSANPDKAQSGRTFDMLGIVETPLSVGLAETIDYYRNLHA